MRGTELWHDTFAHAGQKVVDHLINDGKYGLNQADRSILHSFDTCVNAKLLKSPYTGKPVTEENQLTVHEEIFGPFRHPIYSGKRILPRFRSPHWYVDAQLLRNKIEAGQDGINFVKWFETQTVAKVKRVHADNAE